MSTKTFWRLVDIAAVLAALHLLLYAFTGLALWSPLDIHPEYGGLGMRPLLLGLFHLAPMAAACLRRWTT